MRKLLLLLLALVLSGASASAVAQRPLPTPLAEPLDLIIEGARIVDGTGRPAFAGDVGVLRGRIVALTPAGALRQATASRRIDAGGLVLAPGFVDVHSHTVPAILGPERKLNEGVVRQGVTTVLAGPDGGAGPDDIRRLVEAMRAQGAGTNVATYVGHNAVRQSVMGADKREATPEEVERMQALVREGMELGAVGLSTGLMYEPGMFSTTEEVIALARAAAPYRGIYDSHVRDPVKRFLWSDEEAIRIGEEGGLPPKIGHEKAVGLENAGKIQDVIRMVNAARARGLDAVTDQYPYDGAATAPLTGIVVVPQDLRRAAGFDLKTALRNRTTRARLKEASENGIDGGFAWLKATGYSSMRITTSHEQPALVGKYLSKLAAERRVDPFDLVSDLIINASRPIGVTLGAILEDDVRALMVQPWNMIASDGGYADSRVEAMGHPRSTGTFARVLGHYVRDVGLLSLEEMVRKITSLPADWVGLTDRGRVAEGQAADLVIFDPATIADRSTWDEPGRMAVGVRDVIVNGVPVMLNAELTGAAPGRYLRGNR